mgnify:CR=1 FL=1
MHILLRLAAAAALALGIGATAALADDAADSAGAIRHLMMSTFDRPDSRLSVEPVTVEGDIAVAGWAQGDMGGRALLRRKDGNWSLVLCSGDALRDPKALQTFGLPAAQADTLANAVVAAEAKLDPALLAKFASFDGVVMMDGNGQHPPAGDHGAGHHTGGAEN